MDTSCFALLRTIAERYLVSSMQYGKKGDEFTIILACNGDKAETIVPLGMPSLEMLRRVQALQPPLAGGESGVALDQAIKHAANALAGVKVTKTCQVKIVVLAATPAVATGLPDATGLGDTLRNRAAAEVIVAGLDSLEKPTAAATALQQFAASCGGVATCATDALAQLSGMFVETAVPAALFRGPLDIGGIVKIPVYTFKLVDRARMPSLLKRSAVAPEGSAGAVSIDRTYRLADPPHDEVPPDAQAAVYPYGRDVFPASAMEQDAIKTGAEPCLRIIGFVPATRVQTSWLLGPALAVAPGQASGTGKYRDVPLTHGVSAMARAMADTQRVGIARYVQRATSDPQLVALFPYLGGQQAAAADAAPTGAPAGAMPLGDSDLLVLLRLPFFEELRDFSFPALSAAGNPLVAAASTPAHAGAAKALVDSIDLSVGVSESSPAVTASESPAPAPTLLSSSASGSQGRSAPVAGTVAWFGDAFAAGGAAPAASTHLLPNPVLARVRAFVSARALNDAAPVPELPPAIAAAMFPPSAAEARARSVAVSFKAAFGLRPLEARRKRTRAFGYEADAEPVFPATQQQPAAGAPAAGTASSAAFASVQASAEPSAAGGDASKRARPPTHNLSVGALVDSSLLAVGALDPVGDFRSLIAAAAVSGDDHRSASAALEAMVVQICALSQEEVLLSKALDCVRALRTGCVQVGMPTRFNATLQALRAAARGQAGGGFEAGSHAVTALWASVERDTKLGVITKSECEASTVTAQQAEAFRLGSDISGVIPASAMPVEASAAPAADPDIEDLGEVDEDDDDLL